MTAKSICIVILAAGGSSRLGKPKQLLEFEGETLLRRAAETALRCKVGPVLVVLGNNNNKERMQSEIADLPVEIIFNSDWENGIGSSVGCSVTKIVHERQDISAVLFILCDQPRVDHQALMKLVQAYQMRETKIVASEYGDAVGVPALFDASLFEELMNLTGDVGAKSIIGKYSEETLRISLPEAALDVDSLSDYERLVSKQKERTT